MMAAAVPLRSRPWAAEGGLPIFGLHARQLDRRAAGMGRPPPHAAGRCHCPRHIHPRGRRDGVRGDAGGRRQPAGRPGPRCALCRCRTRRSRVVRARVAGREACRGSRASCRRGARRWCAPGSTDIVFRVVLASRFLPGLRLPTYTTCGFVGADLRQFALAVVDRHHMLDIAAVRLSRCASARCCWIISAPGAGPARLASLLFIVDRRQARQIAACRAAARDPGHGAATRRRSRGRVASRLSFFEFWPDWLFYFPVAAHWIALGLRHRRFHAADRCEPGDHRRRPVRRVEVRDPGSGAGAGARPAGALHQRRGGSPMALATAEAARAGRRHRLSRSSPSRISAATAPACACCVAATTSHAT